MRVTKILVINLLILSVLVEISSAAFFQLKTGRFFYTSKPFRASSQFESDGAVETSVAMAYKLHPYFGFAAAQDYVERTYQGSPLNSSYRVNNYGFLSPSDLPFRKTNKNQFLVGVFGGSVATYFSLYELEHHVLANALNQLSFLRNREIVVLNFAGGSYKQPQQLIVLSYFLSQGQDLDLAINIDGFNEVLFSFLNTRLGLGYSMPNSRIVLPLTALATRDFSSADLHLALEILEHKDKLEKARRRLAHCNLAACYSLNWLQARYSQRLLSRYRQELNKFNRDSGDLDSLFQIQRAVPAAEEAESFRTIADTWVNSSLAMSQILAVKGIPYFHVIQPNQYYPTEKRFTEEERRIAFSEGNESWSVVPKGYDELLSRIESLNKSGVEVINAVKVFDESQDIVYVDNCCHYSRAGNQIFATSISQAIAKLMDKRVISHK